MTRWLNSLVAVLLVFAISGRVAVAGHPHIVLIYADDLGYGDVSCYGAKAVKTPHIDRLAREGLRFTDGHSPSATCTPSRYAMLTGEYAWRRKGTGIARGDAAAIIRPGRTTLASILKGAGYTTGVVGKWHLGLGDGNLDWNGEIKPGPLEIGFDYAFLIPATGDRVPCVYVEDHHVVGLDPNDPIQVSYGKPLTKLSTGKEHPELLKMHPSHGHNQTIINGISRIGYMSGGRSAWWKDEEMADRITERAVAFIERHHADDHPFFLYFSFHDIHVPRVPHPRFVGKTSMGPRGDAIVQLDTCVGEILKTLDKHQLNENTLVIFTSDNGPVVNDGYRDDSITKLGDHRPAGPLRGGKYSAYEGGTRVPFITRWIGTIPSGTSDALICQIDFPASLAALTHQTLSTDAAPDSENLIETLLGQTSRGRKNLVEHSRVLSFRQNHWKIIDSSRGPRTFRNTNIESGLGPNVKLYDLKTDLAEQHNLANQHPEKAQELKQQLDAIRQQGKPSPK